MTQDPEPTARPWNRIRKNLVIPSRVLADFRDEADAELARVAVNAWSDPLALEARIAELTNTKRSDDHA